MREESCLTCKFCQGQYCYRYPPTVNPNSESGNSIYPFMLHREWCGEWVEDESFKQDESE